MHSLVVTLLLLAITFVLLDQFTTWLNVLPAAPGASAGTASGPTASPSPLVTASPLPTPVPDDRPRVVYAAGDIADCPDRTPAVASLIKDPDSLILAIGDIVYPAGASSGFKNCFDPVWGGMKARIRPVPGNHDYQTGRARGYYRYFGGLAGDAGKGWYSFDLGWWHVVAINSICQYIGSCRKHSAQIDWLRADLAAHPAECTLAYWHHPRFSSGGHGNTATMQPIWQALYDLGADLVLSGHDHDYERFAPQRAGGALDPDRGLREFVVGTGGRNLTRFRAIRPNSEARSSAAFGILQLTLRPHGYDWRFVPEKSGSFTDSGSAPCH